MMTPLQRYFQNRGIAQTAVAPGMLTPAGFSDPASEHLATRKACGLFDFSFMACVEISGPHSLRFLHRLQTRNLARLAGGRIDYTLLLRNNGSVLNDATVWCFERNHYLRGTCARAMGNPAANRQAAGTRRVRISRHQLAAY